MAFSSSLLLPSLKLSDTKDYEPQLRTYGQAWAGARPHGKGDSKLPWLKASQPSRLVDVADSDQ